MGSHLKKEKVFIYGHVDCNIAVMKGKDVATLMVPKASGCSQIPPKITRVDAANIITPDQPQTQPDDEDLNDLQEDLCRPAPAPQSPCWYPLAWRTGFPRSFTLTELEEITNRFGDENIVLDHGDIKLYDGILQETPVLVQRFSGNDQGKFWSEFKILSRVRHRNIMNLVGYCCTGSCLFLLFDYPCMGSLEVNLRHNAVTRKKMILKSGFIMYEVEDKAENLSWRLRWYIAQEIGVTLRYLHEECADGPIVHLSVCSSSIVFSHGCSTMLCNFSTAKLLKDDTPFNEASQAECPKVEQDEYLSADVHDYGVLLLELIAGKSASDFEAQGSGQSLIDWALPLLENDSLGEVMDPRIADTDDVRLVHHMARAALFCLKNDSGRRLSISEVLAVVRGDKGWISKYPHC
ncbi:probable serine/threonine-protein kinase PBL25 [Vitis riparia]|uniref:probable serine/threonine-protein kinase PBL25 n=1 Tax=Vitis riparia TaxID=96939 RepID=UPI00155AB90D|nr:probable serine/threonine-protein kinase PBL25 [Vitis riparia]